MLISLLMILFAVSTPLLTQDVNIDLPQTERIVVSASSSRSLLVRLDAQGQLFLTTRTVQEQALTRKQLLQQIKQMQSQQAGLTVRLLADEQASYTQVVDVLQYLNNATITSVELLKKASSQTN